MCQKSLKSGQNNFMYIQKNKHSETTQFFTTFTWLFEPETYMFICNAP